MHTNCSVKTTNDSARTEVVGVEEASNRITGTDGSLLEKPHNTNWCINILIPLSLALRSS